VCSSIGPCTYRPRTFTCHHVPADQPPHTLYTAHTHWQSRIFMNPLGFASAQPATCYNPPYTCTSRHPILFRSMMPLLPSFRMVAQSSV
jgi:hypothetical protein